MHGFEILRCSLEACCVHCGKKCLTQFECVECGHRMCGSCCMTKVCSVREGEPVKAPEE